jgi:PAS domain S-box-containing protein
MAKKMSTIARTSLMDKLLAPENCRMPGFSGHAPGEKTDTIYSTEWYLPAEEEHPVDLLLDNDELLKGFREIDLKRLMDAANEGIWVLDAAKRTIYVNNRFSSMLGYSCQEIKLQQSFFCFKEHYKNEIARIIDLIMSRSEDSRQYIREFPLQKKDGSNFWALTSITPVYLVGGDIWGILLMFIDINERKQMERELFLAREKCSRILNSSSNILLISRYQDGIITEVNDAFCKITGLERSEVIGYAVDELKLELSLLNSDILKLKDTLDRQEYVKNQEITYLSGLAEKRTGLLSLDLMSFENESYVISSVIDVSEERERELEMERLSNIHLLGQIAVSVSHEVRNPLTTLRGYLQMLHGDEKFKEEHAAFELMIEEIDEVNDVLSEFLYLAESRKVNLKCQSLNQIIKNAFPLMLADASAFENSIRIDLGDIPELLLDKKEIIKLLFHLVRNALEATAPGGLINIRTFLDDKQVILSIEDMGEGVADGELEKISKPFYSNKENRLGLGLSICHCIAARHNARLEFDSLVFGTRVRLCFNTDQ